MRERQREREERERVKRKGEKEMWRTEGRGGHLEKHPPLHAHTGTRRIKTDVHTQTSLSMLTCDDVLTLFKMKICSESSFDAYFLLQVIVYDNN